MLGRAPCEILRRGRATDANASAGIVDGTGTGGGRRVEGRSHQSCARSGVPVFLVFFTLVLLLLLIRAVSVVVAFAAMVALLVEFGASEERRQAQPPPRRGLRGRSTSGQAT